MRHLKNKIQKFSFEIGTAKMFSRAALWLSMSLTGRTSNLRKAHVTRDSSGPATMAVS